MVCLEGMAGQQVEILQKLEKMGNLESVVTEQRIRIEKLRTTYETLKAQHLQLQDVSLIVCYHKFVIVINIICDRGVAHFVTLTS